MFVLFGVIVLLQLALFFFVGAFGLRVVRLNIAIDSLRADLASKSSTSDNRA